ncbi:MAG TPA: HPr-rel-A system PqqD family peptide chaperone [Stellaceae bacterium]|nr:HPr-rel-A system PqqD family peptide chaperone [Stellaceae bacterium]
MSDIAPRQRIPSCVQWRDWDGEIVAYNDRTGDTHHFADLAAWLFRKLAAAPASAEAIADAAAGEIELPARIDRGAAIARTLELFARLDLLEPAGS